ncbi:uncharacterized protein PHACADRAFT_251003 [Phanerochaete carnosa HHB-10118-sp]|uniref:Transmembrane protein 135 N-terminal domain-containing protein n=1 Tax=Phanerochaete carnosa (strain HHB-10118-sp) TaxID=650164 RepID=K5XAZ5_PHACS|nr:uncharacterized protein PHACADRAFT_251003 [Phanerochaete carnosa HHB-10118-sp]EKM60112.1 hypothetical protein PHACADRAFT_251003 [Phanerochaete carnosa HHB-10118-sp]
MSELDTPDSSPPPAFSRMASYTGIEFVPKRAMQSFENLVALANYEERLREARKIVWRDKGEKPVELADLWECLEHAGRGGIRAGTLAFAIRSGVNFILLLARIKKVPKSYRFALIRQAFFGPESWRFAAMLGAFVSIYKFVLNSLPILLPDPKPPRAIPRHHRPRPSFRSEHSASLDASVNPFDDEDEGVIEVEAQERARSRSRRARLSMSAQAHQVWVRKKTRRWYSVIAGAVAGGLAILCEKKDRRTGIAQQMFVRGLQGSYNAFSEQHGIRIPHGDLIVFVLCCGQIVYALTMRPETLPPSYNNWLLRAAKAPAEGIRMNRDLVRDHMFSIADIDSILSRTDVTPQNRTLLSARRANALASPPSYGPFFGPCAAVHPWFDSCKPIPAERFMFVFKWSLPIYGALHFIPTLLFKRKVVWREPMRMLTRAGVGTIRSSTFFGLCVVTMQSFFCAKNNLYTALMNAKSANKNTLLARLLARLPQSALDLLLGKLSHWFGGMLVGLALIIEDTHRRGELAMYVLPKALESAWIILRGKGAVPKTGRYGDALLTAVGMGMVMSTYQNDPEHLSSLVRRILYQFVGPN